MVSLCFLKPFGTTKRLVGQKSAFGQKMLAAWRVSLALEIGWVFLLRCLSGSGEKLSTGVKLCDYLSGIYGWGIGPMFDYGVGIFARDR